MKFCLIYVSYQHPATLNIAVPKKTSWYSINQYCSNSKRGITPTGRFVDILRPENAMRTMGALMEDAVRGDVQEQVQTVYVFNLHTIGPIVACRCKDQVPGTTLSWPSAMHVLAEWLEASIAFSILYFHRNSTPFCRIIGHFPSKTSGYVRMLLSYLLVNDDVFLF